MDEKKRCSLTNTELIETAREWVHKLAKSRGDAWCLRIPPDFNHDPDMIFTELCDRLESSERIRAEARAEALERAEMALALMFDMGQITRDKAVSMMRAAILADEQKEREVEEGDLVFWPMGDRGLVDFWDDEIEAECKRMGEYKPPVVLMRHSEVERKLKEAEE